MSRRPGIAKSWYDKFGDDVRRRDVVIERGKQMRPPRYFDKLFQNYDEDDFLTLQEKRSLHSEKLHVDFSEHLENSRREFAKTTLQSQHKRK